METIILNYEPGYPVRSNNPTYFKFSSQSRITWKIDLNKPDPLPRSRQGKSRIPLINGDYNSISKSNLWEIIMKTFKNDGFNVTYSKPNGSIGYRVTEVLTKFVADYIDFVLKSAISKDSAYHLVLVLRTCRKLIDGDFDAHANYVNHMMNSNGKASSLMTAVHMHPGIFDSSNYRSTYSAECGEDTIMRCIRCMFENSKLPRTKASQIQFVKMFKREIALGYTFKRFTPHLKLIDDQSKLGEVSDAMYQILLSFQSMKVQTYPELFNDLANCDPF